MLTQVPGTTPPGQGEPINIIISGASSAPVLVDQQNAGGLRNYYLSLGFSSECLGQHMGSDQMANLGDGHGYLNETAVIRWDYGDPSLGTCKETIEGGNHFRYWVQDGSAGNSGAIFMAVSYEEPISESHDIIFQGYNLGRDWLIGNITGSRIPTETLTNQSTFTGSTSYGGYTYSHSIKYVSGLLPNTSIGINHNQTVGTPTLNAIDGLVAVMQIDITAQPSSAASKLSPLLIPSLPLTNFPVLVLILFVSTLPFLAACI